MSNYVEYKELTNNDVVSTAGTKGSLEVLCYDGSCTITPGWLINDNFIDDDFTPVTVNASGSKKTAFSNLPRTHIKVTNPSNNCKIRIFSYG